MYEYKFVFFVKNCFTKFRLQQKKKPQNKTEQILQSKQKLSSVKGLIFNYKHLKIFSFA